MQLFVDTSDFNQVQYHLVGAKKKYVYVKKLDPTKRYSLLEQLVSFILKSKVNPKKITNIIACSGPGSYTGVRVGLAIGKALAMGWGVPLKPLQKTSYERTLLKNLG